MSDRDEITALVHRYAELLDAGDVEGLVGLFARATWRSGHTGEIRRTPEEVRAVYERVVLHGGSPRTRHLASNLTIDIVDGADDATGRCCYTVLQGLHPGGSIEAILSETCEDRYHRGTDGWHLTDRLFHVDLAADLSQHFP